MPLKFNPITGNLDLIADLSGYQPLDATLTSIAAHNTNGLLTQTAADTFTGRTITGTTNQITVTNGDGVSGNPTLSLPQNIHTSATPTFGLTTSLDGTNGGEFRASLDSTHYLSLKKKSTAGSQIQAVEATGTVNLDLDAIPSDGTSAAMVRYLRNTTTTNTASGMYIYKANGTSAVAALIASNGNSYINANTGHLGLLTNAPTHSLTIGSNGTGIALYNTADQTTNYERVVGAWSGNVFTIYSGAGGTGTQRPIRIGDSGNYYEIVPTASSTSPKFTMAQTTATTESHLLLTNGGFTAASGTQYMLSIAGTINQSSTAGYKGILLNLTETATGSGAHDLLDLQIGGGSKFKVDNSGNASLAGDITVHRTSAVAQNYLYGDGDTYNYSVLVLGNNDLSRTWQVEHRKYGGDVNNFNVEEYDGVSYGVRFSIKPGGDVEIPTGHLVVSDYIRSNTLLWASGGSTGTMIAARYENYDSSTGAGNVAFAVKLTGSDSVGTEINAIEWTKEQAWTGTASTRDAGLILRTIADNSSVDALKISAVGDLTPIDGANVVSGTTTGTKLGTSASQKLALWNATPIVQPTTGVTAATFAANTSDISDDTATWDGYTMGQVVKALRNFGLLA